MNATSVWTRTGESSMSANRYTLWITFWTAFGIVTSAVTACLVSSSEISPGLFIPAVLAMVVGAWIARKNYNPMISLGGYLLITASFGLITGPVVALYTSASVVRILFLTTAMVIGLGVIGALNPHILISWWTWLYGGLLVLLAGQILLPLVSLLGVPIGNAMTFWDWLGVILFSGYVVYDLNRAMKIPYTMNNAIDCAIEVYLDFANLFIRLLSLLGKSNDD